MNTQLETIDGSRATLTELRRFGIDELVKALGPIGMARFLRQFGSGHGDYTAERHVTPANSTVDELLQELDDRRGNPISK